MSADLFAAFGDAPSQNKQAPQASTNAQSASAFSFFDDLASPPPGQTQPQPQKQALQWGQSTVQTAENDDDWGDFEGSSVSQSAQTFQPSQTSWQTAPVKQDPFAFTSTPQPSQTSQVQWQPSSANQDAFAFESTAQASQHSQRGWQPAPVYKAKESSDSNVLFDAEEAIENEDDEFGDFEGPTSGTTSAAAPAGSAGLADLLGDLTVSPTKPPETSKRENIISPGKTPTSPNPKGNRTGPFGSFSKPKQQSTPTPTPAPKTDDTWDSFDDWETSIPTKVQAESSTKPKQPSGPSETAPQLALPKLNLDEPQPGELPPTNVPPPGVLLSLFPPLFAEAQEKLFKPMAAQTLPMRNKLLSEPTTIAYLRGYLALASVAARIIAGRKLRWKRDMHLSQGMRIGPASSRATSGMKLTGIDKSENMKEEREVSDVVRAWKEQIGRLRHVLSAIKQANPDSSLGRGPDLQETLPVRTLKQAEGGIPAPQPCMLCGLKRDERVTEQAVEDSFGEWWIEQTSMHRSCRNFWNQHRDTLRQR